METIISHGFWQGQLGGNPDLADLKLNIAGLDAPVLGVMPPEFNFPPGTDIWMPGNVFPPPPPEILQATRTGHNFRVLGRLRPGVSLSQSQAEMTTIAAQLQEEFKGTNDAFDVLIVPLQEQIIGSSRTPLLILMGSAGLLLLLACANVANLLLAKAAGRQKELAVRSALGAGPGRLFRQLLTENLLLSLLGGFLGILLAQWLLSLLPLLNPGNLPRLNEVTLNGTVLGVTFSVSVLVALLIGVAPAFQATGLNLHEALKEGGRSGGSETRNRLRGALVVSEVALAVVLLIGAGLLISSLWTLLKVETGFDPENILTMEVQLPADRYPGHAERSVFFTELEERARNLPGISAAGIISHVPLYGFTPSGLIKFEGRPDVEEEWGQADYRIVSADYFRTLGIPLLQGRYFAPSDTREGEHAVMVNRTFAERYYPGENPLGQRIWVAGFEPGQSQLSLWLKISGVVGDVKHRGLHRNTRPETYVPLTQRSGFTGWPLNLVVRAESEPTQFAGTLRNQVREMDAKLPLSFRTMDTIIKVSYAGRRFQMLLIGGFAALGLVLATIGIYGVIAYSVSQRTHEIGIRMALGADNGDIVSLILKQGLSLTILGVALGLAGAFAATRLMSSLLFGVSATDPATFVAVPALLVTVALVACYLPARRATKVDPMVALRYE